jgi:glycosyltransferase involved in cell wall biosynthesis
VDTGIFHPPRDPADGRTFRRRHGIPEQAALAAFVGRFVPKKGLTIIRELAARRPELVFALAGAGPVDPGAWGLPNIRLIGRLSAWEVAELMRAADVLILPSVGEGYPLVIQEALACGLPVICGRESAQADPGAARWLRGVDIDLTAPDSTADELASMLEAGLPDESSRREMAAYAAAAYSWPAMAGEVGALLDALCAAANGSTLQPARTAASCSRR